MFSSKEIFQKQNKIKDLFIFILFLFLFFNKSICITYVKVNLNCMYILTLTACEVLSTIA